MRIRYHEQFTNQPDLRHRLRKFRWFTNAYKRCAQEIESEHRLQYSIDQTRLDALFFDWILPVDQHRDLADIDWWDFVAFAAGVALRDLLYHAPTTVQSPVGGPSGAGATAGRQGLEAVLRHWPEGFLHVSFCLSVVAAIELQELGKVGELDPCLQDAEFWWSLRENAAEDADQAICFLDRMLGREPNWMLPAVPTERAAIKRALSSPAGRVSSYHQTG